MVTILEVRDWIGKYYLALTLVLGGYILLFGGRGTILLRIDDGTARDCLQLMIPTLVGQLTIIYRFYAEAIFAQTGQQQLNLRPWIVKWPALGVAGLMLLTVLLMTFGAGTATAPDQEQFKAVLTFGLTVLNATIAFLVTKLFDAKDKLATTTTQPTARE